MERFVEVSPGITLWTEEVGDPAKPPLLLIMGANASGLTWPADLLARLGDHHRTIRYDHRDTGRSTRAYDEHPYAVSDLATDAIAVLDAHGIERAVPTLVIDAPLDPVNPPPHAQRLAEAIPGARIVTVEGMGHALTRQVVEPVADAILAHTSR